MDKKILNEINRSREIMGLGQLIREAVTPEAVQTWLASDGSDKNHLIKTLYANLLKGNFDKMDIPGYGSIFTALNSAFEKITGSEILDSNGEGTKVAFAKNQFSNITLTLKGSTQFSSNLIVKLADGTARILSNELALNRDNPVDVDELIGMINKHNIDNAGVEQIYKPGIRSDYKENGNATRLLSNKSENYIYLWSIERQKQTRKVTDDKTIPGELVAGDVLKAALGDSFENLQIEIKDKSEINDIKSKMKSILDKGGEIKSVTIASTASNTGLQDSAKANFAKMMTDAGFEAYANLDNKKGVEGDFTIDEVNTTDRALAVARGKLLAKELGVEDKAVFKFSITNGPKTVNLSVQGSSPDTKGEDIKVQGTIDDESTSEKKGKASAVRPTVLRIKILDRNLLGKLWDAIGTSTGSKRKKSA